MAGLQRSNETFRRSGSSGLVWEDRFLADDSKKPEEGGETQLKRSRSTGSTAVLPRSRSNKGYRTGPVEPAVDPPSPKVGGCGFCGIFAKPAPANNAKPRRR